MCAADRYSGRPAETTAIAPVGCIAGDESILKASKRPPAIELAGKSWQCLAPSSINRDIGESDQCRPPVLAGVARRYQARRARAAVAISAGNLPGRSPGILVPDHCPWRRCFALQLRRVQRARALARTKSARQSISLRASAPRAGMTARAAAAVLPAELHGGRLTSTRPEYWSPVRRSALRRACATQRGLRQLRFDQASAACRSTHPPDARTQQAVDLSAGRDLAGEQQPLRRRDFANAELERPGSAPLARAARYLSRPSGPPGRPAAGAGSGGGPLEARRSVVLPPNPAFCNQQQQLAMARAFHACAGRTGKRAGTSRAGAIGVRSPCGLVGSPRFSTPTKSERGSTNSACAWSAARRAGTLARILIDRKAAKHQQFTQCAQALRPTSMRPSAYVDGQLGCDPPCR